MEDGRTGEVTPMDEMIRHPGSVSAARLAGCKNFFAAEARDGKVYLPEWNVALPLAGMENTFTTIGIPDNAVTMSENGAMSCTVCRMILGVGRTFSCCVRRAAPKARRCCVSLLDMKVICKRGQPSALHWTTANCYSCELKSESRAIPSSLFPSKYKYNS